jgi:hypothetical protein
MLVAIILDGYNAVKSSTGNAPSLFEQAWNLLSDVWHRMRGQATTKDLLRLFTQYWTPAELVTPQQLVASARKRLKLRSPLTIQQAQAAIDMCNLDGVKHDIANSSSEGRKPWQAAGILPLVLNFSAKFQY